MGHGRNKSSVVALLLLPLKSPLLLLSSSFAEALVFSGLVSLLLSFRRAILRNSKLTMDGSEPPMNEAQDYALRFEDLTVDDDLPLTDRIVRYCRSGIALQRLVHVKMLAETAETVG